MCSCNDGGSNDAAGKRRAYEARTIAKAFVGHKISEEDNRTTHGQSQAMGGKGGRVRAIEKLEIEKSVHLLVVIIIIDNGIR